MSVAAAEARVLALFQGAANVERMVRAMTSYCFDRMNVAIDKVLGEDAVYETVAAATRVPQAVTDVDSMNKRMALRLRDQFAAAVQEALAQERQAPPAAAPQPAEPEEPDFYARLQDTEMARQRISDLPVTAAPVAAPAAPALEAGVPAVPPNVATVFIPTPSKRGQALCIRSHARPWQAPTPRSTLQWDGPLPPFMDATNLRIVACMLPAFVADLTPYIRIAITGMGGAVTECVVIPRGHGGRWTQWEAPAESLSYIVPVPCPWTIRLLDAAGHLLDMGADGVALKKKEGTASAFTGAGDDLTAGDVVWIADGTGKVDKRRVFVNHGCETVHFREEDIPDDVVMLNWGRQWTLHLEIVK